MTEPTASPLKEWAVFSRRPDGTLSGGLPILNAEAVIRRISTGKFAIEADYTPSRWARLRPGGGIVIRRDGRTICTGIWTQRGWRSAGAEHPLGLMSVEGVTDDVIGAYRLVSPNPALPFDGQNTTGAAAVWSMTGPVETVMHALVNLNAGPGARPERRVPGLVMGVNQGRGPTVTFTSTRYPTVQAELRRLAAMAEAAGVRLLPTFEQTSTGRTFHVRDADDRTGLVVFGAALGNLDEQEYTQTAGEVGLAVAGGKGEGAARMQDVAVQADAFTLAFGVLPEVYLDRRDTDDWAELAKATDQAVAEGVAAATWKGKALDTAGTRYGVEWDLNTLATVVAGPVGTDPDTGDELTPLASFDDLVREVRFLRDADRDLDEITAAVGTESAITGVPLPSLARLAALTTQVAALQRNP